MKITVVQPPYYAGEKPDETIARFLLEQMKQAAAGLIVLPEYSNAGGLSEPEAILAAVPRAEAMLAAAANTAREKCAFVAINVLENRCGKLKNSTYLFDRNGEVADGNASVGGTHFRVAGQIANQINLIHTLCFPL